MHLKTKGRACGIIARELALTLSSANFYPSVGEHVPGIANVLADTLSRRFQLGKPSKLPERFTGVEETELPARGREFYRTLVIPPETLLAEMGAGSRKALQDKLQLLRNKLKKTRFVKQFTYISRDNLQCTTSCADVYGRTLRTKESYGRLLSCQAESPTAATACQKHYTSC